MTTLPTSDPVVYTPDEWATRLVNTQPAQWYSDAAKAPMGVLYSLMYSLGQVLQNLQLGLQYSYDAVYLQTAIGAALDSAVADFYGTSLVRLPGETDQALSTKAQASLFQPVGTEQALRQALYNFTGRYPVIVNEWNLTQTGMWGTGFFDAPPGPYGLFFASGVPYQCFVQTVLPSIAALNGGPLYCWGAGFFFGSPTSYWADLEGAANGLQQLYDVINSVKPEGVVVWVQIVG